MLYQINRVPCIAILLLSLVLGLPAWSQGDSPRAPSAVDTIAAYELVEPWIRSLEVPEAATGPDVGGACVTLRLRGRVVGRGTSIGLGDRTLVEATRLAIDEARPALARANDPDAEARALLEAEALVVSLELAGAPVPLDEATYTEISAVLSPGIDAVAVRLGSRSDAVFPLEMLATTQQAGSAASRLVSSITDDWRAGRQQPGDLVANAGAAFFRLKTTAVSQIRPGGPPKPLVRGGRLVEIKDVASRESLERFADELAAWLLRHDNADVYLPSNDTVAQELSDAHTALRVLAVSRALAVRGDDSLDRSRIERMVEQASFDSPTNLALLSVARQELGMAPLELDVDPDSVAAGAGSRGVRIGSAIIAYGLAKSGKHEEARPIVEALRRVEDPSELVAAMPWLGWAELELAGDGEIPSAVGLRYLRNVVTDFQVTAADAGAENLDMVGGVVFTSGTSPLPTWQAAMPFAFLATMIRDERLTAADEVDAELAAVMRAIRYLRQLTASETEAFLYRNPDAAIGGVRAALWDCRMFTSATAMTLLAVLETLESLDALAEIEAEREPGDGALPGAR